MQNNIKRGIFVFLLSTLCIMLLNINVYGLPNEVPEFPHPRIKGQLVSKSKKNSTAFKNLGITIYGNNVQISRLYVKTDSDGHFCLPLQNASGDINVIISVINIKKPITRDECIVIDHAITEHSSYEECDIWLNEDIMLEPAKSYKNVIEFLNANNYIEQI